MRIVYLFLIIFILAKPHCLQAQGTPQTLLWKITGKNIKPSYLYGTMHIGDKRVYFLGDSVYNGIHSCDGFAMEIDPGDYVDTFINSREEKLFNVQFKPAIENDIVEKGPEYYAERRRTFDSMMNKAKIRYNDLSPGDIRRLERVYRRRNKTDMKTSLDLYLYDLAKKQGKFTSGIEDIPDQTSIIDELGNTFDPDEFLKNQRKKYADVLEYLIKIYTDADLDKINDFSHQSQSKKDLNKLLTIRNIKMARRIDSLGNIRSTFGAIGVAHLPGDSGVIALLRKRGLTVTPVFSSKTIEPGEIKITDNPLELINIYDQDSNLVVQLPGKTTALTRITNKLFTKTYKELANDILLMYGVDEDGDMTKTIEREVDELKYYFSTHDIKLFSSKKISRQNLDGYEINFRNREGYIRMHIFYSKGKTFMFAAGSKNKDSVYALRCEKFLSSYKMILNRPATLGATFSFSSADKAFTVAFPAKPKNEFIKGDITLTKEDVSLYSSFDSKNKISYLVMLKEPFKGYFIDFDSAVFIQTFNEIKRGVILRALTQDQVVLDGFPAVKFKIKAEVEGKTEVIYSIMTLRHNRFYNLTARGLANAEYETQFDNFFNSFRFLPYLATGFEKHADKENLFTVSAPSVIYSAENKTARAEINKTFGDGGRTDYYAIDSNTAFSYSIMAVGFTRYYWADGENSLLNEYSRILFNDSLAVKNVYNGDSLVYKKTVFNGTTEGRELLLKDVRNSSFTRLRIIHHGDSIFVINIKGAHELVTDENADLFFNSFRFSKEKFVTNVFTPKTEMLLKDLQTADSRVRSEANKDQESADNPAKFKAIKALEAGFRFPPEDLPKMLNALLFEYPPTKPGAVPIPDLLVSPILQYSNNSIITFIREHYSALKGKHEDIRMLMLNILSASKITEGFILLKEILLNDPPLNASYDYILLNCSLSPLSAGALFPDLAVKITNDQLGPVVLGLANILIDSNRMQYSSIASYEDYIIQLGRKMYRQYLEKNSNSFYLPYTEAVLKLLAKMNKKNARAVLNDFIEIPNKKLTQTIIVALARNGIAVSPEIIDRFCSTPGLRISLYDELYQMGKQSYFTGTYASQRSFAESFATLFTNKEIEESTPKTFELVTFRDSIVNTVPSRFFIFKVTCDFKYSSSTYTGIIGPFSPTADYFSIEEGKELFILYKKKFDSKNIDILFNDFISKIQK